MEKFYHLRAITIAIMLMLCVNISMAQTKSHTVTRGETIESVAKKYGVSVDAIKQANPNMGSMFYVGMKIIIPEVLAQTEKMPTTESPVTTTETKKEKKAKAKKEKVEKQKVEPQVAQAPVADEPQAVQRQEEPQAQANAKTESEKDAIWQIGYYNSLKDGDKGAYGFGADNIKNNQGLGFSMRIYTNLFLVDSDYSQYVTALGANYHYKIEKVGYFVFPALLSLSSYNEISFDDKGKKDTKTKFGCGLLISPYIAIGKKGGVTIGPTFSHSFVNNESSWGGYIGIWF